MPSELWNAFLKLFLKDRSAKHYALIVMDYLDKVLPQLQHLHTTTNFVAWAVILET